MYLLLIVGQCCVKKNVRDCVGVCVFFRVGGSYTGSPGVRNINSCVSLLVINRFGVS